MLLVIAVKYETLCILEVMEPQRPGLVLVAHIPRGLHLETYGGDGEHDLTQLQFVPCSDLPCSVQAQDKDVHFFFCKKGP